jgi:hypothetical protein
MHAVGSADSIAYTVGGTANTYYKIATGAFTWREADGLTCAGDSARILTAGDYTVGCWLAATTSNTNDQIRVKIYVNNTPQATSLGRWIINSTGSSSYVGVSYYMWYLVGATANSYISIHATNLSGNRAIDVKDFKIYIEKKPE